MSLFTPGTRVRFVVGAIVEEIGDRGVVMGSSFDVEATILEPRKDEPEADDFVRIQVDGRDRVVVAQKSRIRVLPKPHDPSNCHTCDHEDGDRYDWDER